MELPTWDLLDAFFMQGGDSNCSNNIVRHQIESFNEFIDKQLIQIIQGFNSIQVCHNYNPVIGNFKYKIYLNILKPSIVKPMYQTTDGTQMLMTPHLARMNNLTYASNLYVDIHVVTDIINDDGVTERKENTITNVCIGKIPIMIRSKACVLSQMPGIAEGDGNYECRYDYGGYFIINGNEKVIISQDRISENKTLVFAPNGNGDGLYAEIRSMPDGMFFPPKTTGLHLSGKSNHMGNIIRLSASFLRAEVPLFLMFRALGVETDKEIYAHIVLDLDAPKQQRLITQLAACAEDACDIHTQTDAFMYLLKILGTTGTPKEFLDNPKRAFEIIKNTIRNDFLSHVGHSFKKKALYLGYMVKKLLSIHLGYLDFDNRDSYLHKRIDTPGILFSNLFRQCYGKLIKEVRNLIVRELNLWRASTNITTQLINQNNVHRFFKQTLIETGLRYALSTGNWGVKSIGSFQNIRQGVAQVLNRMSYLSTLSHLRRINTPMEKNGKLVQPRKLENSQYGMICPNECFDPETPILLWNGIIKKAQDIIVGDYLIDDNGKSIRVKSTCSGHKTMYEIIPTKKNFMNYTVTDNHILTLKVKQYKSIRNHRGKKEFSWFDKKELKYKYKDFNNENDLHKFESTIDNDNIIDITIEKYLSLPKNVQTNLYTFKSDGIHWEYKDVALDPYILGMWLGDGLSCGYGFVTADKELLDKWIEWGKDNDATIKKGLKYNYHISSTINNTQEGIACNKTEQAPLAKLLRVYNLVKNKHIPLDYLVNDRKTRLEVLAGLIDTDGNVRANGHEIRICQGEDNYKIIYDAEFLARSLGFSCHLNDGICTYTVHGEKRKKPYKELSITGQYLYEIPTVLPRKKLNKFDNPITNKRCSSFLQSSFKLIQKDVQPFVGWQVEGTGRFLLSDMSVTHNTPEGAAVGLVKNIALSTHITVNVSSAFVRETLAELGTELYGDHITDTIGFLKRMGSEDAVHIMINGDIIGFHTRPDALYSELKHLKRYGSIPPTTSIVWDVQKSLISLSTEAGRMIRPLYIVDQPDVNDGDIHDGFPHIRLFDILNKNKMTWKDFHKRFKTFKSFVAPMVDDYSEGFIEYMDVDEIDKGMVAMFPNDLKRMKKGTTLPPLFTHCEIEPSLLNGVLAANIPFMDHNQAPRNCYQCIWVEEPVLLTNGNTKIIKNIAVGDEVYCFNLKTNILEPTRVIYQQASYAGKPIKYISVISGRRIIATNDHKFMTPDGWKSEMEFTKDTKLYVCPYPVTLPHAGSIDDVPIKINKTAVYNDYENIINELGLGEGSLTTLHNKLPIIARLAGYMYICNPIRFANDIDKERFDADIKNLGFTDGLDDRAFMIFMMSLDVFTTVPSWVLNGTLLVRREYVNGYLGGYMKSTNWNNAITDWTFVQDIGDVTFFTNFDSWSNNNSSMMKVYSFAYSQKMNMEQMRKAEYDKYCKFSSYNKDVPNISKDEWNNIVEINGDMLALPIFKITNMANYMTADITVESDHHSFIGGDGFAVSNSAMGKQAVGIYMSNFNHRIDTMAHVLHYPQKPLVRTKLAKYTNSMDLPSGINAIVAIMTHTGFNQEDSVMLNKSAVDRGLFTSTYFKSYRDQCSKNHSTGEEEVFTKPVIEVNGTGKMKPFNYDKLGEDGFIPKNIYVDSHDILVGKVMPQKVQGVITERDTSLQVKGNDDGYVDMNYQGINGDGYKFCKIRMRKYRKPQVGDKLACMDLSHTILVRGGKFLNFHDLNDTDEVAVLVDGKLTYEIPSAKHYYPDFKGKMYHISNQGIDLNVTYNHRMWVSSRGYEKQENGKRKDIWLPYKFEFAEDIFGKRKRYKKDAEWNVEDYQFILPELQSERHFYEAIKFDMDAWLTFFGIWIAEGWTSTAKRQNRNCMNNSVVISADKPRVQKALANVLPKLGYKYTLNEKSKKVSISNIQLYEYMHNFSVGATKKSLPKWVWELSKNQTQILIEGMLLGDGHKTSTCVHYYTSSAVLAEELQVLTLHAGWTADINIRFYAGHEVEMKDGRIIKATEDSWIVNIHKNRVNPTVNHGHVREQKIQEEYMYDFEGPVFCLTVSSGVFMVKNNGKAVWTGNSRSAQKGTIGMVYNHQDMPFSKDGISPDIIMNPHAIPSRMTIGQLMECIMGKACCHIGSLGDSTPFTDCSVESIANVLAESGFERYGNEILYNGRTGEQMKTEIFIGPTYYQRLKHMVADKSHSRGSNGPIVLLTRQPAEGRARNGGLRFGEMERDAIVAHGASTFLKERMLDVSDNFRVFICRQCGLLCTANPEKNIYKCTTCKNNADITQVRIPYAMKLLIQELMTMGVSPRITV